MSLPVVHAETIENAENGDFQKRVDFRVHR